MNLNYKGTLKTRSITPLIRCPSKRSSIQRNQSTENNKENIRMNQNQNLKINKNIQPTIPKVSARAWVVLNNKNGDIILAKNCFAARQVASLTKIMTILTSLKICEQLDIPMNTLLNVSKYAATQEGTSAMLEAGQKISIQDLLYALMLPSGNDAAVVLAEGLSHYIRVKSQMRPPSCSPIIPFINRMQQYSYELNLNSKWANPHGLQNQYNKSNAYDIALLCKAAMEMAEFKKIVNTKQFKQWNNTNKLLDRGWDGIKTGVTTAAGPCLAAAVSDIIIVLLGCKSMESRWEECHNIYEQLYIS